MRLLSPIACAILITVLISPAHAAAYTLYSNSLAINSPIAETEVPVSSISYLYAKRSIIPFEVCGGGPLLEAARDAADSWNTHLGPRVLISVSQSGCAATARFRNGLSEIYYGDPGALVSNAAAIYQGLVSSATGTLGEEDILVDKEISEQLYLANILTHELGHALGLDHAVSSLCRASVMAEVACSGFRAKPTAADLAAARRIYGAAGPGLAQFDLNGSGFIEDREFFQTLDLWLAGNLADRVFFEVADLWLGHKRLRAGSQKTFQLRDAERVQLFDLNGRFLLEVAGGRMESVTKGLLTGTYIYKAIWQGRAWLGIILIKSIQSLDTCCQL